MIEALVDVVALVPTNKIDFGSFIDCLYWLFYEGAGSDKLRFLAQHGGPLVDGECKVIWDIKILRNKLYRHDPDHGDQASIKGSYRSLGEALGRLGFAHQPYNASHYRSLHRALVRQVVVFLSQLIEKLSEDRRSRESP
jgi:hypothetical protein